MILLKIQLERVSTHYTAFKKTVATCLKRLYYDITKKQMIHLWTQYIVILLKTACTCLKTLYNDIINKTVTTCLKTVYCDIIRKQQVPS